MRHRISSLVTGLGNPSPPLMDGGFSADSKLNAKVKEAAKEVFELFLKNGFNHCDAQIGEDQIRLGVEPAYQYQKLKMITVHQEKKWSSFSIGYAWEAYGSGLRSRKKYYKDYKFKSKFIRFIDKWHPIFFPHAKD